MSCFVSAFCSSSSSSSDDEAELELNSNRDSHPFSTALVTTDLSDHDLLDLSPQLSTSISAPSDLPSRRLRRTAQKSAAPPINNVVTVPVKEEIWSDDESLQSIKQEPSPSRTECTVNGHAPMRAAATSARANIQSAVNTSGEDLDDSDDDSDYIAQNDNLYRPLKKEKHVHLEKRRKIRITSHKTHTRPCKVILTDIIKRLNRHAGDDNLSPSQCDLDRPSTSDINMKEEPEAPIDEEIPVTPTESAQENQKSKSSKRNKISCPDCEAELEKEKYYDHHRDMHTNRTKYRCLKCSFSAPRNWQLTNNEKFDHGRLLTDTYPVVNDCDGFKCDACDFNTKDEAAMKRHSHHHTDKKINLCLYCSYSASTPWLIKEHMKTGHKSLAKKREVVEIKSVNKKTPKQIQRAKLEQEQYEIKIKRGQVMEMQRQLEIAKQEFKLKEKKLKAQLRTANTRESRGKQSERSQISDTSSDTSSSHERANRTTKWLNGWSSPSSCESPSECSSSSEYDPYPKTKTKIQKNDRKRKPKDDDDEMQDYVNVDSDKGNSSRTRHRKIVSPEEVEIVSSEYEIETKTIVNKSVTRTKTKKKLAARKYMPTSATSKKAAAATNKHSPTKGKRGNKISRYTNDT